MEIYKVTNKVNQIYTSLIEKGKVTISFNEPPIDIFIQSNDIAELKKFLSVLITGSDPSIKSNLPILNLKNTTKTRKSRQKVVDLSNQHITSIDNEYLNLEQLVLKNNKLGQSTQSEWQWLQRECIRKTLWKLNMSSNELTFIPEKIKNLNKLVDLDLSNNLLSTIPQGIGTLKSLKFLNLANNQLKYLPGSLGSLKLTLLNISGNPLSADIKGLEIDEISDKYCVCSNTSFLNNRKLLFLDIYSIASNVISSFGINSEQIIFNCYFCSEECEKRYGPSIYGIKTSC